MRPRQLPAFCDPRSRHVESYMATRLSVSSHAVATLLRNRHKAHQQNTISFPPDAVYVCVHSMCAYGSYARVCASRPVCGWSITAWAVGFAGRTTNRRKGIKINNLIFEYFLAGAISSAAYGCTFSSTTFSSVQVGAVAIG